MCHLKPSFLSELTELAELTKATTKKLIKTINRLSDDPPKFNQQFEVIFKRFITLMNLTSIKLKEAKVKVRIRTFYWLRYSCKTLNIFIFFKV
jgi:hypothetical protein